MPDIDKDFTLRGQRLRMRRQDFIDAVRDEEPRPLQVWAIEIDGRQYPPKQVVRSATGLPHFTTHEANAVLRRFGFDPFDVTRSGGQRLPPPSSTSDGVAAPTAQQQLEMRVAALREAVQWTSSRPDGTAEEVLQVASVLEGWLAR
jgi:hypothetical protein